MSGMEYIMAESDIKYLEKQLDDIKNMIGRLPCAEHGERIARNNQKLQNGDTNSKNNISKVAIYAACSVSVVATITAVIIAIVSK